MKKTYKLTIFLFYLAILIAAILDFSFSNLSYLLLTALMPLGYLVTEKFFHIRWNEIAKILYLLFVTFSMTLGHSMNFYRFYGFDKFLHFTSGLLIASFALVIYGLLKGDIESKDDKECALALFFLNGGNMLAAFLWECFEFALLVFFNNDAIHHYDQGVYDTMGDMIVCFLGGLIISISYVRYYKTKRKTPFLKAATSFVEDNR